VAKLSAQASKAAVAVYAWDEAAAHLRAALRALQRTGAPLAERASLAERLGVLLHKVGTNLQDGIGHLEEALAAYQATGDQKAAVRVHSRLGIQLTTYPATLDVTSGLAHCQTAEAVLARQPANLDSRCGSPIEAGRAWVALTSRDVTCPCRDLNDSWSAADPQAAPVFPRTARSS
jgi:hypothetical protein